MHKLFGYVSDKQKENVMAISWNDGTVTHVGLVIGNETRVTDRVMSDIYADQGYIQVYDPDNRRVNSIVVWSSFELVQKHGTWTADITTGEYADDYEAYLEECRLAAIAREAAEKVEMEKRRQQSAKERLLTPNKGMQARVFKGRKAPIGTVGEIIWLGEGNYGPRVGVKEANGTIHWIPAANIEVTGYGLDFGEEPVGGWAELEKKVQKAAHDQFQNTELPIKGQTVRYKKNNKVEGKVFWVKGERLGFKKGRKKTTPANWANKGEVEFFDEIRNCWRDYKTADREEVVAETNNPLKDLPAPYCDIRKIDNVEGKWVAKDLIGTQICVLPEETAKEIQDRLR